LDGTGRAFFTTRSLATGPHAFDAVYAGDHHFLGSSADPGGDVSPAPTTTTESASPNPAYLGDAVTFSAFVTSTAGTPPGGTVDFFDNTTETDLGAQAVNGMGYASVTVSNLTLGSHSVTAAFSSSDPDYADSVSPAVAQSVFSAPTTTQLWSSADHSVFGDPVTFSADVTSRAGTPTGQVQFVADGTTLATVPVGSVGTAPCTTAGLGAGPHTVKAVYTPDTGRYSGGTSDTVTQVVGAAPTTTVLYSSQPTSDFEDPVEFTAYVSSTD